VTILVRHFCFAIAVTISVSPVNAITQNDDWYHPRPPGLPDKDTPLVLPITTARPIVPIPVKALPFVISELSEAGLILLSGNAWAKLRIPLSADELLTRLIEHNQQPDVFPLLGGLASKPRSAEEISHWKNLKNRGLKPYLVRAVASGGDESKFFADLWRDELTIIHCSVVNGDLANDPLHQHAAITINPQDIHSTKSPVIVYLEREPKFVFTELQVVKEGL
jgi:hypothetical protein